MKFCKKCGTEIEDNTAFCPNCGENITLINGIKQENSMEASLIQTETVNYNMNTVMINDDFDDKKQLGKTVVGTREKTVLKSVIIVIALLLGSAVFVAVHFSDIGNSNKLDGIYYDGNRVYLGFSTDGACVRGRDRLQDFYNSDPVEIMERGTYELSGSTLVLHLYDGANYYDITYTYDKSSDTISITTSYFGTSTYYRIADLS